MAKLRSVGRAPARDTEAATNAYVTSVRGTGSLTQGEIDSLISTAMAPYATTSYVNTRDELNASKAQVDAGDATKLKKATIDINDGVPGLDSTGRVPVARVPGTSTQRWPDGPYTPAAYASTATTATGTTPVTVFTHTIADPGYPFKLLISGCLDVRTATNGDAPVVQVRVGSTSGPVVATGTGSPSQYRYGVDTFNRVSPALGAGWEQIYTGPGDGHTETSTKAFWVPNGTSGARQGFFRKIGDFSTTESNYQEVSYRVVDACQAGGIIGSPPHNRIYGRVNSSRTTYIAFDMTATTASLISGKSGVETTLVAAQTGFAQNATDEILAQFGYYAGTNERRFRLVRNGTVFIDWVDTAQVTTMTTDNRSWGFGHQAGAALLTGQSNPASLDWIALNDPVSIWGADPENYSPAVLTSTSPITQSSLIGNQTLYVTLKATSTGTVYASTTLPKLHVITIPA